MASIRKEIAIGVSPEQLWDAVRDVGQIHRRLAPGFLTDCRLEGDSRVVTFGNGRVARELLVDVDDATRRAAWSVQDSERLRHHNASLQVFAEGAGCRAVWIADVLPNEAAPVMAGMIEQGLAAMKRTLENGA